MRKNRKQMAMASLLVCGTMALGGGILAHAEENYKITALLPHTNNAYMQTLSQAIEDAGKDAGVEITVLTCDNDAGTQLSQMETTISQGVDGIILDPFSTEGIIEGVKAANEAGIPVVTIQETMTSGTEYLTGAVYIDTVKAGELMMEQCVKDLGGKGNVAIMNGKLGEPVQLNEHEGFDKVLAENPDIEVVVEGSGDWTAELATTVAESWLSSGKQIDAICSNNDGMASGIRNAIESAGKTGEILLYGLDAQQDALQAIKDGSQTGTIYMDGPGEAVAAVDALKKTFAGETLESKDIIIDPLMITKENVDEYLK